MFNKSRFCNQKLFLEWLNANGEKTFDYMSNEQCCFAQWAMACGAEAVSAGAFTIFIYKSNGAKVADVMFPDSYLLTMDLLIRNRNTQLDQNVGYEDINNDLVFTFAETAEALKRYIL